METLVFELLPPISGNGDYTIGTEKMAEMTLDDDVAEVILTLDDGDMDEATLGTGSFTVTRDDHGNKDQPINVFVKLTVVRLTTPILPTSTCRATATPPGMSTSPPVRIPPWLH